LQPSHEGMRRAVALFWALRVLNPVQNFIALVDSRSSLLFARKAHRVVEVADDPTILEVQFRREIKRNRHAAETPGCTRGSREKSPTLEEHPCGGGGDHGGAPRKILRDLFFSQTECELSDAPVWISHSR